MAEIERIQARNRLEQKPACVGWEVHTDEDRSGRHYFRWKTVRTLAGPLDTTEAIFKTGTEVSFTEIPDAVRAHLRLPRGNQRAIVTVKGSKITFRFNRRPSKPYAPLKTGDTVCFKIVKVAK